MYYMELPKHFTVLRDISDTVEEYLCRELYKEDFNYEGELQDDYTAKDILGLCYSIILEELKNLGVTFTIDENDLIQDIYTCGYVYLIRKFLDHDQFIHLVKATDTLTEIDTYISTDEEKPDLLADIINLINVKSPSYELGEISYILPSVHTDTSLLVHYISTCLEEIKNRPNNEELDEVLDDVTEYIAHIRTLRNLAKKYTRILIDKFHLGEFIDWSKLNKLLKDYDRDKLENDVVHIYAVVDTSKPLPPEKLQLKKEYMDKHHATSPHHKEYWITDNPVRQQFTLDNLVLLIAHHVEPGSTVEDFIKETDETISVLNKDILPPDAEKLAIQMRDYLIPFIEKDPELEEE